MPTTFTITDQDYVKGSLLNGELTRKTKLIHFIIDILLVIAGLISLAKGNNILAGVFIGAAVGGFALPLLLRKLFIPYYLKRHYKKYRQIQRPINIQLTAEGVFYSTDTGSALLKWADIFSWRENADYILIYVAPRMYHIIPTRLENDSFPIKELKNELTNQVGIAT